MQQVTHISAFKKKMRSPQAKRTHAGSAACPTTCPPDGGRYSMSQIAAMQGRRLAGASGQCAEIILPLTGTIIIGATTVLLTQGSSPVGLCVNSIVAIQNATLPVQWSDLTIRNNPQWIMGEAYDEALFAPDAECSCCLPLDCIDVGASVSVRATVPAAVAGADFPVALYLIGTTVR